MAVSWVLNVEQRSLYADLGPYLGTDWPLDYPHLTLPADSGEVDWLVVPAGTDLATFDYAFPYANSWNYGTGHGTVAHGSLPAGAHFVVQWYNTSYSEHIRPPSYRPEQLAPAAYVAVGELGADLEPNPDPIGYALSDWVTPDPILIDADTLRAWFTAGGGASYPAKAMWTWQSNNNAAAGHGREGVAWSEAAAGYNEGGLFIPELLALESSIFSARYLEGFAVSWFEYDPGDERLSITLRSEVQAFDYRPYPGYRTADLLALLALQNGVTIAPFDPGDVDGVTTFDFVEFEDVPTELTAGGQVSVAPFWRTGGLGMNYLPAPNDHVLGVRSTAPYPVGDLSGDVSAQQAAQTKTVWSDVASYDAEIARVTVAPTVTGAQTVDQAADVVDVDLSTALVTLGDAVVLNLVAQPDPATDPGYSMDYAEGFEIRQTWRAVPRIALQLPRYRYRIPLFTTTAAQPLRQVGGADRSRQVGAVR